jgi:endoglucanase
MPGNGVNARPRWPVWAGVGAGVLAGGVVLVLMLSGTGAAPRSGSVPRADGTSTGPSEPATPSASPDPPSPSAGSPTTPAKPVDGNPLSGYTLYLAPTSSAIYQVTQWQSQGRAEDAKQLTKISSRPVAYWLTDASRSAGAAVSLTVNRAATAHQMPVLVVYAIPQRDCGGYSSGGAATTAQYQAFVHSVADGTNGQPATIILEPDAVAHSLSGCGDAAQTRARYAMLHDTVTTLKANKSVRVYLDAGHSGWIGDLKSLAAALRQSGITQADGFALNVSNFETTQDNIAYGQRLSNELGGTHFVIDTSRNGNGPYPGGQANGGPAWCNPPGRMLGPAPTTNTGQARVDAYLWVKPPGESDGACRPGEPPAGQWWPEYALDLAKRSP